MRTDPVRIHILGTGAMAGFFGARLAKVADVALLGTWAEGLAAIAKNGIVLETPEGEEAFPVRAVRLGTPLPPADLVLVLVKAWQTDRVAGEVPALTARGGQVLTLQNGLGNVEKLGARALLGVTSQGATLLAPGRVRPGGDGPTHIAGPDSLAAIFRSAGLDATAVELTPREAQLIGLASEGLGVSGCAPRHLSYQVNPRISWAVSRGTSS